MSAPPEYLSGLWYLIAPAHALKAGAVQRRTFFGEPVALGRDKGGRVFALRDVCPHRGAPLSKGRLTLGDDGRSLLSCPYHGWAFDLADGACADIPALPRDKCAAIATIRARRFTTHEAHGLIWIHHGEGAPSPPTDLDLSAQFRPLTVTQVDARADYDEAVIGLIDPAHTPFVHRQWWWREGAALKEKTKTFEPTALGFKMPAHQPSSNSRIYRMFGGAPTTEIEFRLPGVRIETIRLGTRRIVGLTGITPTEEGRVQILHVIYADALILRTLRPLVARMARDFLAQDGAILDAQSENLSRAPHRPLYMGDADELAKRYLLLKRAWASRGEVGFLNPTPAMTLHWRT